MTADKKHFDLFYKWVRFNNYFDIADVLRQNEIKDIAIYGAGTIGVLLFEALYKKNISVKYIVDKNKDVIFPYDVKVVLPEEIDKQSGVDAILITTYLLDDLRVVLEKLFPLKIKCISISDLLIDMDEFLVFRKLVAHIKACGAELMLCDMDWPLLHENPTADERLKNQLQMIYSAYYGNIEALKPFYDDIPCCTDDYIAEVYNAEEPVAVIKKGEIFCMNDVRSEYYNVVNNCRITTNQPTEYDNIVYFYGNCCALGIFADDEHTIESYLQRKILEKPFDDKTYCIRNYGTLRRAKETFERMLTMQFKKGDKIIVIARWVKGYSYFFKGLQYYELDSVFDRPHKYGDKEIFFDLYHTNHRGYDLLSDKMYEILSLSNEKQEISLKILRADILEPDKKEEGIQKRLDLEEYLSYLNNEKVDIDGSVGAVVMNCNPFTLGHKYLIKKALGMCDFLYIFVVEENRSFFSFEDRFEMVKRGVADIDNVKVLRSGKHIISSYTLPEYFVKDNYKAQIDASLDMEIFSTYIAPTLNIRKRFVGQEPLCNVTNQYNQAMKKALPQKGIEVIEFERMAVGMEPVSASMVRKLIEAKNIKKLEELVPVSTIDYLKLEKETR